MMIDQRMLVVTGEADAAIFATPPTISNINVAIVTPAMSIPTLGGVMETRKLTAIKQALISTVRRVRIYQYITYRYINKSMGNNMLLGSIHLYMNNLLY